MTLRKETNKKECLCAAYDESECGCGNFPSKYNKGWNDALDVVKERLEKMPTIEAYSPLRFTAIDEIHIDQIITELSGERDEVEG